MPSMSKPLLSSAALGVAFVGGRAFTLSTSGAPGLRGERDAGARGAQHTDSAAYGQSAAVLACGAAVAGAAAASGNRRAARSARRFFTKSQEELEAEKQTAEAQAEAKRYQEFCDARDKLDLPAAVPFLGAPRYREFMFNVPGDSGFDPLNLCSDPATYEFQRTAELKHGRLAMLAAAGWPLQEIYQPILAQNLGMQSQLAPGGRSPSLLNGGLNFFGDDGLTQLGFFFTAVLFATVFVEIREGEEKDKGFDLLGAEDLSPPGLSALLPEGRKWMAEAEIKNGRIAMIAITAYVVEEFVTRMPVVADTPYLFSSSF